MTDSQGISADNQAAAATLDQPATGDPVTTSTATPSTEEQPVIENPAGLLNAFDRLKLENAGLKDQYGQVTSKLEAIESTLGKLDANTAQQIKAQLEETERVKAEQERFRASLVEEKTAELEAKFLPQISRLEQSNVSLSQTLESFQRNDALARSFSRHNGENFPEFAALLSVAGLTPEFTEVADPLSPTGERKEVKRFTKPDGSAITDEQGKELEISEIYKKSNQGGFGASLRATFRDYNQASGDGFYQGSVGSSDIKNPWSEKHFNLTTQGKILRESPALARQMASQAGKTIA